MKVPFTANRIQRGLSRQFTTGRSSSADSGTVGVVKPDNFTELLQSASAFAGPRMREAELGFIDAIAALLTRTGHAPAWRSAGLSAADLAGHLFLASAGAKAQSPSLEIYRERVCVAVRIVLNGRAGTNLRPAPRPEPS
ncbi:hypothetical protein [Amycolatopsis panacis]|uniref:hypothetical protein n=1 Tax=Amycolatopsis panacis TaxID=2340917 RepID=UPI0011C47B5E|nr:hypothetical protein [Amycolatopsis panacis]